MARAPNVELKKGNEKPKKEFCKIGAEHQRKEVGLSSSVKRTKNQANLCHKAITRRLAKAMAGMPMMLMITLM